MAGRFLLQKLASESTGLLRARSSARDLVPITRHASEGGIGTLGRLFDCTVVARSHAAKSFPSFSRAAKMSNPTTGMPSHRTKPASLDSVRGVKRTFSSSSSDKGVVDWEARKAFFLARLEANKANVSKAFYESEKAAIIARIDARKVDWEADAKARRENGSFKGTIGQVRLLVTGILRSSLGQSAEFNRFLNILLIGFAAVTLTVTYEFRWSPRARRGNKSQAASGGCCCRES